MGIEVCLSKGTAATQESVTVYLILYRATRQPFLETLL